MTLQGFSFPLPETRLFHAGGFIYKVKIRGGPSYRGVEVKREDGFNQEMEEIIRSVMGNLDNLQPFSSTHYNVFPYKKPWKVVQTQSNKNVDIYPFVLILYLDKSNQIGKPKELKNKLKLQVPSTSQSKRRKSDSPLEEAALKDLLKDMEAEGRVFVTNPMKTQHKEAHLGEDLPHQQHLPFLLVLQRLKKYNTASLD
ncbi:membrane-anchored junction protein isoform X3 [Gouania willdenowi]|uniref:membrane-anchored junction protein isoform X3 n=1 Tax=Gouania willdenowi TaxID=441366 RepID=UPI0010544BFC|nr:membrane-anchored junction protein isoform X3 [Gouania willdenowi]